MHRVLVIGLDGGTFRVIEPFAREGIMPCLGGLMARGASGILRSTEPPYTGPGWSSFMTGTNPGKHSNYDVQRRTLDYAALEPAGYHTLAGTTLWDIASAAGRRTVLLNMPMTYPPPAINGIVVTGPLTPPGIECFTYPEALSEEIRRKFGHYLPDLPWASYGIEDQGAMLDELERMMDQHEQVSLWALARERWDLAAVVLVAPDRIQHSLWRCLGIDGPVADHDKALRDRVRGLYATMDRTVHRLMEAAGSDANVIVVSDHGFGPIKARVDLNNLLADVGLLAYRGERGLVDSVGKRLHALGLRRRHVAAALRPLGIGRGLVDSLESGNRLQGAGSVTDWGATRAFSLITNGVFVNLCGREPEGIVATDEYEGTRQEIIEKLCAVRDPDTGDQVIHRVQRREEVYAGPYLDYAPDLMITEYDERYYFHFFPHSHFTTAFNDPDPASGNHAHDGILIAQGPDIAAGEVQGARLVDMMPTLCALLDLAIPPEVDGDVLESLLRMPRSSAKAPGSPGPLPDPTRRGLTEQEQQGLEERLRGLGYL
ncbi:alkaline phosphatase family protein [Candidatus Fermentibacteria bacterium]|nr:alkaline phosphatase family protein [Candidatus Fermentibacteria bacterium]